MAKNVKNDCNENVRRGDVYYDMISGNEVIVESVNKDGTVTLSDGKVLSSLVCFKYLRNEATPLEIKVEDFSSEDGGFFYLGEKVETGTLETKDVLASIPDGVLVTAADKRKGCILNLYKYIVEDDVFFELSRNINSAAVLYNKEHVLVIKTVALSEHKIPAKEEGAEPVIVEGRREELFFICDGRIMREISGHFGGVYNAIEQGDKTILVMTSDKVLKEEYDTEGYPFGYLADTDEGATEVVEVVLNRIYDEDDEERTISYFTVTDYRHHITEPIASIAAVKGDGKDSLFVITNEGIYHTLNGRYPRQARGTGVVEAAKSFPHLVRLDAGRVVNKFYLANDNYEVVCITVTLTEDRGYVTAIEPI